MRKVELSAVTVLYAKTLSFFADKMWGLLKKRHSFFFLTEKISTFNFVCTQRLNKSFTNDFFNKQYYKANHALNNWPYPFACHSSRKLDVKYISIHTGYLVNHCLS